MKEDWKEYIAFSRKERRGVVVLLMLLAIVIVAPDFFPGTEKISNDQQQLVWRERIAKWKQLEKLRPAFVAKEPFKEDAHAFAGDQFIRKEHPAPGNTTENDADLPETSSAIGARPFPFDPNTIRASGWQQLGIPDKVIRTILNYLSKGGQFRQPEDLGKIYGMRQDDAKRLQPFVKIEKQQRTAAAQAGWAPRFQPGTYLPDSISSYRSNAGPAFPPVRKKRYANLDINAADTTAWSGFPGIGSKLALRIVNYREKLGGFYSTDQVGETWALPDSTFQKIKPWLQCGATGLRKIRINEATVEALRQHPYLRWQLANAIVQYRQQHGAFRSAEDLQGIILMTPLLITRIAPYIEY